MATNINIGSEYLPDISEIVVKTLTYAKFAFNESNKKKLDLWMSGNSKFDCFCIFCQKDSIFTIIWDDHKALISISSRPLDIINEKQEEWVIS